MCRIVGFWDFNYKGEYNIKQVISSMRDTMTYGGPDDAGFFIDETCNLAMGHRRLSIIDLSQTGHQPMVFENFIIVYNGEIYNFSDIKKELIKEGYSFYSDSDTEVILKAFQKWSFKAVDKFRGMFAFAIWDKNDKKLLLCRDRVGVKPMYYYYKDGLFMFSSELKSFHKHPKFKKKINIQSLSLFLQYGYITAPYSIFEYTNKLEPGNFLIIDKNKETKKLKYWDMDFYLRKGLKDKEIWLKESEDNIARDLEKILTESFKLRLVSDVPVGIFLSGGIDSTLVTTLLQKNVGYQLKTFTIGFNEKNYNEAEYAKKISNYLGTNHTELYCTPKDAFNVIPKLPEIYDEPFGDSSAIPTYLVSKLAKNQVKVALSADGGDEQFYGYTRYWIVRNLTTMLSLMPLRNIISKILQQINPEVATNIYLRLKPIMPKWNNFRDKYIKLRQILQVKNIQEVYDSSNKYFLEDDLIKLGISNFLASQRFKIQSNDIDNINYMMYYDIMTYLPDDILTKVDRATMSVALEGREPFLDHKILEYSLQMPIGLKYRNGMSKYIIRKILYKHIPKELIDRPKMGFGVPIYEWFKNELKELYLEYLSNYKIKQTGLFDYKEVDILLQNYLNNKNINHNKLWFLFIFQIWSEKWM
jgi:asparagine synthase (glutamine-hydrolysing)